MPYGLPTNVQAFIRRAWSMADKTSWTKPLACMAYGDSIVGTAWLEAGTAARGASDRRLVRRARTGMEPTRRCATVARSGDRQKQIIRARSSLIRHLRGKS